MCFVPGIGTPFCSLETLDSMHVAQIRGKGGGSYPKLMFCPRPVPYVHDGDDVTPLYQSVRSRNVWTDARFRLETWYPQKREMIATRNIFPLYMSVFLWLCLPDRRINVFISLPQNTLRYFCGRGSTDDRPGRHWGIFQRSPDLLAGDHFLEERGEAGKKGKEKEDYGSGRG